MRDKKASLKTAIVASLLAVVPACAGLQPVQRIGSATPSGGVEVAVLREGCTQNVDPESPGADLVDATVETVVSNRTDGALIVRRDRFRLVGADGQQIPTSTWGAAQPIVLAAGQTETFQLRFSDRGGLTCSGEMRLDAPSAISKEGAPLPVASVLFRPAGA